jgi:hypothetical protein
VDLAGYWNNVFHQDVGLATGGGNLVDYGGIPLNEAGRMYALSWNASRMTVRQQQCPGYVAPYFYFAPQSYRFWEERDPYTQELIAIKMYGQTSEQTPNDLDGWTAAPAGLCATYLGWLCHGDMGRAHSYGPDNPPQARLAARQWASAKRPGHVSRALHQAWRTHHVRLDRDRPCVPG